MVQIILVAIGAGAGEERRHRDVAGGGQGHVQRQVMALEAPAPREAAGRAEYLDEVAAGIAEAALLLAQHAFIHRGRSCLSAQAHGSNFIFCSGSNSLLTVLSTILRSKFHLPPLTH